MKVHLLLLPLIGSISLGAFAKVSYEDALESVKPYEDANAAVHNPPDNAGLGTDEFDPNATESDDTGTWVKLSSNPGGAGMLQLAGYPSGGTCVPVGVTGRTSETREECDHQGNGDYDCDDVTTHTYYSCN